MSKLNIKYGRFSPRLMAYILDLVILGMPFLIIAVVFITPLILSEEIIELLKSPESLTKEDLAEVYNSGLKLEIALVFLWALINSAFLVSKIRATPGKKIMGLQVVNSNNETVKITQAIGRYAALPLIILMLGVPDRYIMHENLQEMEQEQVSLQNSEEMQEVLNTSISPIINIITLLLICGWYLNINRSAERKAFHDILFDTRVIYAEK